MMQRKAFSMIELVFVIVVLGILAAVAVPKFSATRDDAEIAKGRADVAAIRSGIITERQTRMILGNSNFIPNGSGTYTYAGNTYKQMDNGGLFGGVLMYPKTSSTGRGHWSGGGGTYVYHTANGGNTFTYTPSAGTFKCTSGSDCAKLQN